ncbi:DNA gyrase/topoisomerase IV subunit A [Rhodoflexus caldus]|uniref:DNA gyrase/topoisomerase IV subunit A n=1 Tax=Rhodoflexus caldus TaxID=2891236 RepID=UPI002029E343|nr:DNA gyrase/topoisomerase IV subunit A [Rhodoflexus caldus]
MEQNSGQMQEVLPVSGMYENWFLDYASYVILERAVPAIEDGFKPVQRRILHSMKEMDDGRYNKVANIIGQTMQYHPHGDASISDAIVNLGQKDLLIDTQGNWGDIRTGDGAAAPRYIEARLSKFALDVVFNPQTTEWQASYDGRKKEPVTLPVKFPLLLAQGVEGIAVGLSTKILPHNFCELIRASIDLLKGREVELYPDFPTGGMVDVTNYQQGRKGGKVRVRARIEEVDSKTLAIRDIPYGTTTTGLIESIIKANDAGKIKIKKVVDNTAKDVEILIHLEPKTSPDITIGALYAFTDCEVSISPNACVIVGDKPQFLGVDDILKINTEQTLDLLRRELEIKRAELLEKQLYSSLEKIFIENRIYRDIEECTTWEDVILTIDKGISPYKPQFYREITREDIIALTEIKIKRISKYDAFKADELMRKLAEELAETEHHLAHLVEFAIDYFKNLLAKYGKGRERKTEIRTFDTITATKVAANNQKLYINRKEGFIGFGLKKDEDVEFISDCSDIDDIVVFLRSGVFKVVKIAEKVFVGKDILHAEVFNKDDERRTFNMLYLDGESGITYAKRFQIGGITRDKEYDLTKGTKGSKVLYFTSNPNGEAELITVTLTPGCKAKVKVFDYDFTDLAIKGRSAQGNILTRYPVKSVKLKMAGVSTLGGLDIYYDPVIGRLNTDKRGYLLGTFTGEDTILALYKDGTYEMTNYDLANRYEPNDVIKLYKLTKNTIVSAIYFDGENQNYYAKRFQIETTSLGKKFSFLSDHPKSKLLAASADEQVQVKIHYVKADKKEETAVYDLDMLAEVRGWKALGNRLPYAKIKSVEI